MALAYGRPYDPTNPFGSAIDQLGQYNPSPSFMGGMPQDNIYSAQPYDPTRVSPSTITSGWQQPTNQYSAAAAPQAPAAPTGNPFSIHSGYVGDVSGYVPLTEQEWGKLNPDLYANQGIDAYNNYALFGVGSPDSSFTGLLNADQRNAINDANKSSLNLSSIAQSLAPVAVGGLLGAGVGGTTGAQVAGNAALQRPLGENLGNAALADVAGAGLTGAAVLGGAGASGATDIGGGFEGAVGNAIDPLEAAITEGQAAQAAGTAADPLAQAVNAATAGEGAAAGGGISPLVAGGGGAAAAGGGTALSRLLSGTNSTADLLSVLGIAGATGLGVLGANRQADASKDLANQLYGAGAPSRARFEASMTPGFDPRSIPGYAGALDSTSEAILRKLSATSGNPFGNPGGLIEANKAIVSGTALPAIQAYQNQNAAAGGFGSLAAGYPGAGANAVGAQGNVYNAIGSGLSNLFNPQPDLTTLLRSLGRGLA